MRIYHLAAAADWAHAASVGLYTPPSLALEGFIHASTREQLLATTNRYFPGRIDLVVLTIDVARLRTPLRFEAAAPPGTAAAGTVLPPGPFPHLHGPLLVDDVLAATPLLPDPDGVFRTAP